MLKQFKLGQFGMKASALTVALLAVSLGVQAVGESREYYFLFRRWTGELTT